MFSRSFLFAALLLCLAATPAYAGNETAAQEADSSAKQEAASPGKDEAKPEAKPEAEQNPAKEAAAQRYLANINLEESFENIYEALGARLPPEHAQAVLLIMRDKVRLDTVHDLVKQALMLHYTTEELEALAEFYSSDVGRSITNKLPAYLNDVNMAIQEEAQRAFELALDDMRKLAQEMAAEQAAKNPEAASGEGAEAPPAPDSDAGDAAKEEGGATNAGPDSGKSE